jgi:hypothetical protein
MLFTNLRLPQIFRDLDGCRIFIKLDDSSARMLFIGGYLGELLMFHPSDSVETRLDGKMYN